MRWLVLLALAGCSAVIVVSPRDRPQCTESYAAPIVDTVIAALATTAAVVVATSEGEEGDLGLHRVFQVLVGGSSLLAAIGFSASAVHGYRAVTRCRRTIR
jgi:hypothetical protein